MPKPPPAFAISKIRPRRSSAGGQFLETTKHSSRPKWYRPQYFTPSPFAVSRHKGGPPRFLLDRNLWGGIWTRKNNLPDASRWERIVNSMRVTEDRVAYVEESGVMYSINWKMYCTRLESELQAERDAMPQFTIFMQAVPISWKKLDIQLAVLRGLSARECMAQSKLSLGKGRQIVLRALEMAMQGAEGKGLDKDKLRVSHLSCFPGPVDKQVDIRSRGYYSWKTKRSSHLILTLTEDPDMILPNRIAIPYASMLSLKRAGLRNFPILLDIPAISAESI